MKTCTAFATAGVVSLFAWDAAFAQSPSQIPVGAGANVTRQPAGSRFRNRPLLRQLSSRPSPLRPFPSARRILFNEVALP
jgi:hypothetical protein